MSKGTYYITKTAIYLHGVYGPYPTRKAAREAFKKAYEEDAGDWHGDFDGHHDYHIIQHLQKNIGKNLAPTARGEQLHYQAKRKK